MRTAALMEHFHSRMLSSFVSTVIPCNSRHQRGIGKQDRDEYVDRIGRDISEFLGKRSDGSFEGKLSTFWTRLINGVREPKQRRIEGMLAVVWP